MIRFRQNFTGFTLVELMVTVAVIAVILVIGVPGIANMKRSGDLTTTSKELVVALNYARAEAVRQGASVQVGAIGTWGGGWNAGTNLDAADPDDWVVYRQFKAPPTGSSVALSIGAAPITFAALGNVSAASCFDISVTGSSLVRSVDISPSGRVTTCKTSCAIRYDATDPDYDPTNCD
ncbi:MAG: GspH/FimT family pseudopilin [Gammaproteobacteria bacterium]|nr:GspH/FimT family pseudopilin [Gammaproteobacteria bacterium]MCB1870866.1 GspH/FimT family pseudopilin [Gammaproteobacteria bacterium]MCB1903299.1 GspH/FimT family pseudopilin [Gammaproteobacteria bacterium]